MLNVMTWHVDSTCNDFEIKGYKVILELHN